MTNALLIIGGLIFSVLGLLHGIFTIADISRPRRLVPMNLNLIEEMAKTGVSLARGRTNMWDAWLGFNISHSLGVILFGAACAGAGIFLHLLHLPKSALLIPAAVGCIYFLLAIRFWFRIPAIGIAIGTGCFLMGWLFY